MWDGLVVLLNVANTLEIYLDERPRSKSTLSSYYGNQTINSLDLLKDPDVEIGRPVLASIPVGNSTNWESEGQTFVLALTLGAMLFLLYEMNLKSEEKVETFSDFKGSMIPRKK